MNTTLIQNTESLCEILHVQVSEPLNHIRQMGAGAPIESYRNIVLLLSERPTIAMGYRHKILFPNGEEVAVTLKKALRVDDHTIAYGEIAG